MPARAELAYVCPVQTACERMKTMDPCIFPNLGATQAEARKRETYTTRIALPKISATGDGLQPGAPYQLAFALLLKVYVRSNDIAYGLARHTGSRQHDDAGLVDACVVSASLDDGATLYASMKMDNTICKSDLFEMSRSLPIAGNAGASMEEAMDMKPNPEAVTTAAHFFLLFQFLALSGSGAAGIAGMVCCGVCSPMTLVSTSCFSRSAVALDCGEADASSFDVSARSSDLSEFEHFSLMLGCRIDVQQQGLFESQNDRLNSWHEYLDTVQNLMSEHCGAILVLFAHAAIAAE